MWCAHACMTWDLHGINFDFLLNFNGLLGISMEFSSGVLLGGLHVDAMLCSSATHSYCVFPVF